MSTTARAIEEVPMPRMSAGELRELVTKGFGSVGMGVEDSAVERIVRLSEGLPSYAHLLSLKTGERVLADDRDRVLLHDVLKSTESVVESAISNRLDYHKAIRSSRPENLYPHVLAACALAAKDRLGYFTAKSVAEPMSKIMGKPYAIPAFSRHLASFLEDDRGCVLQRTGEKKRYLYRFRDPMMQPFAILAAIAVTTGTPRCDDSGDASKSYSFPDARRVETRGFEPLTLALQRRCSTN